MESAPGSVASAITFRKLKSDKHQILEAVKSVAHGAESVMYFQWRKGRGATEKFHGAVVDHYGKEDTRIFRTVSEIGKILKKLDCVIGCGVKSDVAIVQDTPTWWALGKVRPSLNDNGYFDNLQKLIFHILLGLKGIPFQLKFRLFQLFLLRSNYFLWRREWRCFRLLALFRQYFLHKC